MEQYFPILLAVTVALFVWAISVTVVNVLKSEKRKLAQRLSGTGALSGGSAVAASIVMQSDDEGLSPLLARSAFMRALHRQLVHAYPDASLTRFLALSAGIALFATLALYTFMDSLPVAFVAGLAGAYFPYMLVCSRKNKRQRHLAEQLPDALDFLQRILRAGHSLSTGLAMMAEELPAPLSAEFRRCYDQHSLGQPLEHALKEMASRIESTDFAFFVTAVLIQRQTGGDLSQVLGNISGMIRQRIRLQQYVKAKTAEGRFTGYILVAFPILMFFIAYSMNPDYGQILLHTSTGLTMLAIAGGLVVAGLLAIRKITTVKV
jgi:tight adherence protein B